MNKTRNGTTSLSLPLAVVPVPILPFGSPCLPLPAQHLKLLCSPFWRANTAQSGYTSTWGIAAENQVEAVFFVVSLVILYLNLPSMTKSQYQPVRVGIICSSMKLYTWNNAVWQILLSWQLTKPRLSIGLPDGEAWFVTSVNRLCALHHCIVGYFTCKTTLTYVCQGALSMGWTSFFFLSEGVTGSGVHWDARLGKIILNFSDKPATAGMTMLFHLLFCFSLVDFWPSFMWI